MPKLDLSAIPRKTGTIYPEPFAKRMEGRSSLRLGQHGGLSQFGINLVSLEPGAPSSLRHWHLKEDEFVVVTDGPLTMRTNEGETIMETGDCVAFPAGEANAHCFVNHTDTPRAFLVVGTKIDGEQGTYPDDDLVVRIEKDGATFAHHDGTPYKPPE